MLGERYRSTVSQVAVKAGIRPTARSTLLQVAATAIVGVLGRFAVEQDFSPTDFVYWLHAQKEAVEKTILPGAGLMVAAEQRIVRQAGSSPTHLATATPLPAWADQET